MAVMTGISKSAILAWAAFLRRVCGETIARRQPMLGTAESPVQVDEALFSGRRKYGRGRLLASDHAPKRVMSKVRGHKRSYGGRVSGGAWVFGLIHGRDLRYYAVRDRSAVTLMKIVRENVVAGSVVHSDEWPGYNPLRRLGYDHATANHQLNYVDPRTGAHTQAIERTWLEARTKVMRQMRGTTSRMLQGHLDEACYQHTHRGEDIFMRILGDIRKVYRQWQHDRTVPLLSGPQ